MEEMTGLPAPGHEINFLGSKNSSLIKVIGVGGGGSNAVNYMYRQSIPDVRFVVCNTDKQHLDDSPVENKLLLGENITHGRGAGNKPEVGKQCAEASVEKIKELFDDGTEMVFITAGMGGGTGTGAAPVIARLAKEANMLTIGIVTIPFMFEGNQKINKALDGAEEMRKHVDALLLINNQNLIALYPELNFFNAFEKADDTLANAARSVSDIISQKCYINVDFEDVRTTLKDSGTAIISTAYGEGKHRIADAISNALNSPLMKKHDIYSSKRLLLKFACSRESANAPKANELAEINHFTSKLPGDIDVKWGVADDPSMGDKVKVTVLASGFDVTITDEVNPEGANGPGTIVFKGNKNPDEKPKGDDSTERIAEFYGLETVIKQRREAAEIKYAVLTPDQYDDHDVIMMIENTPALNRSARFNEELKKMSVGNQSLKQEPEVEKQDPQNVGTISFEED